MVRLSRNDYPGTFGKDFVQKPRINSGKTFVMEIILNIF